MCDPYRKTFIKSTASEEQNISGILPDLFRDNCLILLSMF